jgi:hypothetical protein
VYAEVLIRQTRPTLFGDRTPAVPSEFENVRLRLPALLRSRQVLEAALKQPGIADLAVVRENPDPVGWLAGNLRVSFGPGAEVMRVELDHAATGELAPLLDAVLKSYLARANGEEHSATLERYSRLETAARQYRANADQYQKRLDTIARDGESDRSSLRRHARPDDS